MTLKVAGKERTTACFGFSVPRAVLAEKEGKAHGMSKRNIGHVGYGKNGPARGIFRNLL